MYSTIMAVSRNKMMNTRGVTLVEVMISLVILLFVFMGLIQASLLSINSNMRNEIRDTASSLAAETMSRAKATSVDTLATVVCPMPTPTCPDAALTQPGALNGTITRQVKNVFQSYNVVTCGCFADAARANVLVTVRVAFTFPGETAVIPPLTINSMVRRP